MALEAEMVAIFDAERFAEAEALLRALCLAIEKRTLRNS
jgi:hypothetical protein